jgi:hypothetical protein
MTKLKILTAAFFVVLISSLFFINNALLFSSAVLISDVLLIVGLYVFLSGYRIKRVGKNVLESMEYPFTYVMRMYTKPKNLWIKFDYNHRKFTAVGWGSMTRVAVIFLFGAALIFTSYLILFTITQAVFLIVFRSILLFIFLIVGLYSLFLGLYRFFSIETKRGEKVCRFLNRNKFLIRLIENGTLFVQITPNFLLKEGFVDSVEFILSDKADMKRLEKVLIGTVKVMNAV